ncbi:type II secretion system protein TadC [Marinobacterium nitratireducens]|uniref:Type II secretion system protein TadC n=1 Tax=Marinobacterium nitratireducens TaxID=518897 RepID=A0A918DYE8_9GAMM|nr:type II secretion system F family protein [Marinobacterium nitratireducens]GGO88735.1 type II secretion system protein TadC [Marinobacterium nitratireducens]
MSGMTLQQWLILSSLVLGAAGMTLVWWAGARRLRRRIETRLAESVRERSGSGRLLAQGQEFWRKRRRQREPLAELSLLLRQAGRISNREQVLALLQLAAFWLVVQLLAFYWGWQRDLALLQQLLLQVFAAAGGAWALIRWLRWQVAARAARIDEQLLLVLQIMRILWEVGMSLESMLRTLSREIGPLAPDVERELGAVRAKIESGETRERALGDVARLSQSNGFQDLMLLLTQVSETGGGMSGALADLSELLQDRRRTCLHERVSKLSGRMSAVMMLLLFPALLLVLAGPGFLALVQALQGVG